MGSGYFTGVAMHWHGDTIFAQDYTNSKCIRDDPPENKCVARSRVLSLAFFSLEFTFPEKNVPAHGGCQPSFHLLGRASSSSPGGTTLKAVGTPRHGLTLNTSPNAPLRSGVPTLPVERNGASHHLRHRRPRQAVKVPYTPATLGAVLPVPVMKKYLLLR